MFLFLMYGTGDPTLAPGSCCHLMLFVALDGSREELELPASNLWICERSCIYLHLPAHFYLCTYQGGASRL